MRTTPLLLSIVVLSVLCAGFPVVSSVDAPADVGAMLVSLSSVGDVERLLYEAAQAGVLRTADAALDTAALADIVAASPQLLDSAVAAGIVSNYNGKIELVPGGLSAYVERPDQNALKNILTRAGVLNSFGKYDQKAVLDIITRYNPNTQSLDPKMPATKEEEDAEKAKQNSKPANINSDPSMSVVKVDTDKDTNSFKLESAKDIYELILQAYSSGVLDQDGNFIETSFKKLLSDEPVIARMFRTEKIATETNEVDYNQARQFVEAHPSLSKLLSEAGIYVGGEFSKKAVSDVIFRYNEETGKLDKAPLQPVVDQVVKDEDAEKERKDKLLDTQREEINLLDLLAKLTQNPNGYLRDSIAYARRQCVFDARGNFDSINLFNMLSATNNTLTQLMQSAGIFSADGTFSASSMYKFISAKKDLRDAAEALGVMTSDGFYDQEAVLAITSQYPCRSEVAAKPFDVQDPLTVNTVADLKDVLARALTFKVLDTQGVYDYTRLQEAMDMQPALKANLGSYGVFSGNILKGAALRDQITAHPLLKAALYSTGIYDQYGLFSYKAFTAVLDSVSRPVITSSTPSLIPKPDLFAYSPVRERVHVPSASVAPVVTTSTMQSITSAASTATSTTLAASNSISSPSWAKSHSGVITGLVIAIACVALLTVIFGTVACVRRNKTPSKSQKRKQEEYHMV